MAKKATIQILRGVVDDSNKTTLLGEGEMFYDTSSGLFYVGDGISGHTLEWLYNNKKCLVTLDNLSGAYPRNTIAIGNGTSSSNGNIAIGTNATSHNAGSREISIGTNSITGKQGGISIGSRASGSSLLMADGRNSISLGNDTEVIGENSVALGNNAKVGNVDNAIQLGKGTNSTSNTLCFGNGTLNKVIVDGSGKINADTAKDYNTSTGTIKTTFDSIVGSGVTGSGDAPLQGYDTSKGTIESRLSSLGFNQGDLVVQLLNTTVTLSNDVNKQGNVVWCSVSIVSSNGFSYNKNDYLLFLPNGFSPTSQAKFNITKVGTQDGICGHFNANGRQGFAETNPPASFYDSGEYRIIFCWRIGD